MIHANLGRRVFLGIASSERVTRGWVKSGMFQQSPQSISAIAHYPPAFSLQRGWRVFLSETAYPYRRVSAHRSWPVTHRFRRVFLWAKGRYTAADVPPQNPHMAYTTETIGKWARSEATSYARNGKRSGGARAAAYTSSTLATFLGLGPTGGGGRYPYAGNRCRQLPNRYTTTP